MAFLKVITSLAIATFCIIFLNNLMAIVFPPADPYTSQYDTEAYKKCELLEPDSEPTFDDSATPADPNSPALGTSQEMKDDTAAREAYDKCTTAASQEFNDKQAIEGQYQWLRSIVVLLLLVGLAIYLFKKFPFFSGALIGTGLLFAISYPLLTQSGGFFGSDSTDLSSSIRLQIQLVKMAISLLGLAGLAVADILFFEKDSSLNETKGQNA